MSRYEDRELLQSSETIIMHEYKISRVQDFAGVAAYAVRVAIYEVVYADQSAIFVFGVGLLTAMAQHGYLSDELLYELAEDVIKQEIHDQQFSDKSQNVYEYRGSEFYKTESALWSA